jgi:ABC-type maltose transport system permease subunit
MEVFEAIKTLIILIILFTAMSALPFFVIFWFITNEGKKNKFLGLVLAFIGSVFLFWMWGSQFSGWDRSIGKISLLFS